MILESGYAFRSSERHRSEARAKLHERAPQCNCDCIEALFTISPIELHIRIPASELYFGRRISHATWRMTKAATYRIAAGRFALLLVDHQIRHIATWPSCFTFVY